MAYRAKIRAGWLHLLIEGTWVGASTVSLVVKQIDPRPSTGPGDRPGAWVTVLKPTTGCMPDDL